MRTLSLFTIVFGLIGSGSSSRAAPIKYILSEATFNEGGVATGSFTFNNGSFPLLTLTSQEEVLLAFPRLHISRRSILRMSTSQERHSSSRLPPT